MNARPFIYLLILGSSWGLYFSIIKLAVETGISYWNILLYTTVLTAIGIVCIVVWRKKPPVFNRQTIVFYTICAVLSYFAPFILEMFAADNLPASVLTLIITTSPIFTLLFAALLKTDVITPRRTLGMIMGVAAACLVLFPAAQANSEISTYWVSIALLIPVAYGLHENYVSKYWPAETDSLQLACGEAIIAVLFFVPVYFYFAEPAMILNAPSSAVITIVIIAIMGLFDIFLYFELIRIAGPIFTSQASYLVVISGVIWGMIIFGEKPDEWIWGSIALLLLALFLIHDNTKNVEHSQGSPG